jgi:hypothetical protein
MSDEKELQVRIRYVNDPSGAKEAQKTADSLKDGTKQTGQGADQASARVKGLNDRMNVLAKISAVITVASGVMFAGMMKAAQSYVGQVGTTETASKRWILANQSIEESTTRIGRVIVQDAIPYLEQAAKIVENIASFAEKNPQAVDTVLKFVGGSLLVGGIATVGAGASKLIGGIGGLLGAGAGAASSTGAAAVAGSEIALGSFAVAIPQVVVAFGLLAGATIALQSTFNDAQKRAQDTLTNMPQKEKDAASQTHGLGESFGSQYGPAIQAYAKNATKDELEKYPLLQQQLDYTKQNMANAGGSSVASDPLKGFTSDTIIAYNQYYRQEEQALRAHLIQLGQSQRDFDLQQSYEVADYNLQRSRTQRDFDRQEAMSAYEYGQQRFIAARDFGIQMVRSEQDFQKQRQRATEDFQFQLWDIARSGDAFSYMQATRQFKVQQNRDQEDYDLSRQRSIEDFTRSQADQAQDYQVQRAFRLQSFQIELGDQEQDFQIRRDREAVQRKIQLSDMEQDWNDQERARRQAVSDALNTMNDGTEKAAKLFSDFSSYMIGDMQVLVDGAARLQDYFKGLALPSSGVPSKDMGGYTSPGLYMMHDEFVLSPSSTRAAEKMMRGRLNQDNVLAMLSGGGGAANITINDHRRFDSRLSPEDRRAIRQDNENLFSEVFG